jgi:hypothetical protein
MLGPAGVGATAAWQRARLPPPPAPGYLNNAAAEEPAAPGSAAGRPSIRPGSHQNAAFVTANEALVKMYMEQHRKSRSNTRTSHRRLHPDDPDSMAAKNRADVMEMFGSWVPAYKGGTLSAPADVMTYAQRNIFFAAPLDGYRATASSTVSPTNTT